MWFRSQNGDLDVLLIEVSTDGGATWSTVEVVESGTGWVERAFRLDNLSDLPGESLRAGSVVQVNERVLIEPYAHGETPPHQYRGLNRLGDGEYFLLGDNRAASTDSRDFGPVRREQLQGLAWLRYWPPGRLGRLRPPPRRFGERRPGGESELPEDHRDDPAVAAGSAR